MLYKITNIKLSLKTSYICLDSVRKQLDNKEIKCYSNFIVLRDKYTYIIFKSKDLVTNHINVTKIGKFEDVPESIIKILSLLQVIEQKRVVDNITVSLNLHKEINLNCLPDFSSIIAKSYNTEKFPGVFLKFDCGTIILFHTGKCILIGVKKESDIECLISKVVSI